MAIFVFAFRLQVLLKISVRLLKYYCYYGYTIQDCQDFNISRFQDVQDLQDFKISRFPLRYIFNISRFMISRCWRHESIRNLFSCCLAPLATELYYAIAIVAWHGGDGVWAGCSGETGW